MKKFIIFTLFGLWLTGATYATQTKNHRNLKFWIQRNPPAPKGGR